EALRAPLEPRGRRVVRPARLHGASERARHRVARGALRLRPRSALPHSGETRRSRSFRSPAMGKNASSGDGLVDYLVRVMFLTVILIVALAVLGNQVATVLHRL